MAYTAKHPPDLPGLKAYGEQVRDTLNFLNIRGPR